MIAKNIHIGVFLQFPSQFLFCYCSFSGVNGKLLVELTVIKTTAPDSYYSIMRDENKMSMVDLLRFNTALNELA